MEFDKVLARVRKLVTMAEAEIAPGATPDERQAALVEQQRARAMADALMLEYSIAEITADQARPASERQKPGILEIVMDDGSLSGWISTITTNLVHHCHCRIRKYTRYDRQQNAWIAKIYGFEADLRYFEILYTTIRLHMLGVLVPRVDSSQSLEENCYRLHNAGYNWLEIAAIYGWSKYNPFAHYDRDNYDVKNPWKHKKTEEVQPATQVGSRYKRAYERACRVRGEQPTQIPAGGSETFRHSAADGYVARISRRLREVERQREPGAELILRTRVLEDLDELFRQDNPDLYQEKPQTTAEEIPECQRCKRNKSGSCREHPLGRAWKPRPYSAAGYHAGVQHANSADLSPNKTTRGSARELAG